MIYPVLLTAVIIALLIFRMLKRMGRYPTEKGLRFFTLFSISPVFINRITLKLSNALLNRLTRKQVNTEINAVYFKKGDGKPLLIYIHGGGFFFTAPPMALKEAKRYSDELDINVLFPIYITSDRKPYPAALDDIKKALSYAEENIKYSRLYIGGDSAGGNLALELTGYALKEKIKVDKLLLIYPVVESSMSTPSMKRETHSPSWNSRLNRKMWDIYLNNGKITQEPVSNLEGFPETFIEVEEYDSLHDEGLNLALKMKELNVPVTILDNKRTYHGFDYFKETPTVKASKEKRTEFLKG